MSDNPEQLRATQSGTIDVSVESLASRAMSVLASKRAQNRPLLSERLIADLIAAARGASKTDTDGAITDILHSGVSVDEVLDFYIPEAARQLGAAWSSDGLGFADVTIATARLQRALRALAGKRRNEGSASSVLVAVTAGEHHTLGAMVLTEQLRRHGLSVRLMLGEPDARLVKTVAEGHFDAIFLSVANVEKLVHLRGLVENFRKAAQRSVPIVVGGAIGQRTADIREKTGADHVATDHRDALRACGLKISSQGAMSCAGAE